MKLTPRRNDLATLKPHLVAEWDCKKNHPLTPNKVAIKSHKKAWWKCNACGHSWQARVADRSDGTGCPACAGRVVISGTNDLATLKPHLVVEWDYEKNHPLTPDKIAIKSEKKVWWKCNTCGHSWSAIVCNRTDGSTCPACAGKVVISGKNDLATLNPHSAAEWDYEKNYPLTPDKIAIKSGKKVWWRCKACGKTWQAKISNRTANNTGCPACAGRVVIPGKNDLAMLKPHLVVEWDYEKNHPLTPDKIAIKSGKRIWWKCSVCGYSWSAKVYDRTSGSGCPACAGKVVISGTNDLATLKPHLVVEWDYEKNHPLAPDKVTIKSGKNVWWKCNACGHSWQARVAGRSNGISCPACAGKVVILGKNDLATLNPHLVAEWDFEKNHSLVPEKVSFMSHQKAWWRCIACGHSWQADIHNRAKGRGCPNCAGKRRIKSCIVPV